MAITSAFQEELSPETPDKLTFSCCLIAVKYNFSGIMLSICC
tara:strand:+ start:67 stop:192 length:126 start_codon:yes stop_codon:yes gene_type:complete